MKRQTHIPTVQNCSHTTSVLPKQPESQETISGVTGIFLECHSNLAITSVLTSTHSCLSTKLCCPWGSLMLPNSWFYAIPWPVLLPPPSHYTKEPEAMSASSALHPHVETSPPQSFLLMLHPFPITLWQCFRGTVGGWGPWSCVSWFRLP
jgi:hypothetical protein